MDEQPQDDSLPAEDENDHGFEIGREHKGLSLFDFLDAMVGPLDRKAVGRATRDGHVTLNGDPTGPTATLTQGDLVELTVPAEELARTRSSHVPLLHRSETLVVGDKPSGLPFDSGRRGGPSALEEIATALGGEQRPRPVHRLDKDTSGVVVAALGRAAEEALTEDLGAGRARVEYLAVVRGSLREERGVIDVPLGKRSRSDSRMVPDLDHGAPSSTTWALEEQLRGYAIVRLIPAGRGRSHQVRAHLAAWGRPALCDRAYGEDDRVLLSQLKLDYRPKRGRPERPILARPALHAERFVRGDLEVVAPIPQDLSVLLAQLRRLFAVA